jgi:hypothetical protein
MRHAIKHTKNIAEHSGAYHNRTATVMDKKLHHEARIFCAVNNITLKHLIDTSVRQYLDRNEGKQSN